MSILIFHYMGLTEPCENPECDREVEQFYSRKSGKRQGDIFQAKRRYCENSCALRVTWHNSDLRAKQAEVQKALWQNPEHRAKFYDQDSRVCAAENCDRELSGHRNKKYCSDKCKRRRKTLETLICATKGCDREFERDHPRRKYCSDECRIYSDRIRTSIKRRAKVNPKARICAAGDCNREFTGHHNRKFCSDECRLYSTCVDCETRIAKISKRCNKCEHIRQSQRQSQKIAKLCAHCRERFWVPPSQFDHKCCSQSCAGKYRASTYFGREVCASILCNKEFQKKNSTHKYCSQQCKERHSTCASCGVMVSGDNNRCKSCSNRDQYKIPSYREANAKRLRSPKMLRLRTEAKRTPEARLKVSLSVKARFADLDYYLYWLGTQPPSKRDKYICFEMAKRLIHTRDRGICRLCGVPPDNIDVHHIDVNTNNQHPYNLISLCDACHDGIVHPNYRNERKRETQETLTEIATVRSRAMSLGWWEEYGTVLERAEIALQLREV